jgi:hypothetical protein
MTNIPGGFMRWLTGLTLTMMFSVSHAQTTTAFQDWIAGTSTKTDANTGFFSFAGTSNANSDTLDEYCYQKDSHCEWRVTTTVSCVEGDKSMVIVNGTKVFDLVHTQCLGVLGNPGMYTYKLGDWKALETTLAASGKIAFVFAMQDSAVYVARFSCIGSVAATAAIGGPIVGERHNAGMSPASATGSSVL